MVPAGEPGHGDDVADDGGGDDRPDAGHLGEAGAGCRDRGGRLLAGLAPLGVQVADAGQQLGGELAARLGHRAGQGRLPADPGGLPRGDLVRYPTGNQLTQHGTEPAGDLVAGPGRSRCRLARTVSTTAWPSAVTSWRLLDRDAATATDRASSGPVLLVSPASGSRTRAASSGCTSPPARRRRPAAGPAAGPARGRRPPPRSAPARPAPRHPASRPGPGRPAPAACPAAPRPHRPQPRCASPSAERSRPSLPSVHSHPHQRLDGPRRACLIPDLRWALVPLPGHATARSDGAGTSIQSQAHSRQAVREPAPVGPLRTLRQPQHPVRVASKRRIFRGRLCTSRMVPVLAPAIDLT